MFAKPKLLGPRTTLSRLGGGGVGGLNANNKAYKGKHSPLPPPFLGPYDFGEPYLTCPERPISLNYGI